MSETSTFSDKAALVVMRDADAGSIARAARRRSKDRRRRRAFRRLFAGSTLLVVAIIGHVTWATHGPDYKTLATNLSVQITLLGATSLAKTVQWWTNLPAQVAALNPVSLVKTLARPHPSSQNSAAASLSTASAPEAGPGSATVVRGGGRH